MKWFTVLLGVGFLVGSPSEGHSLSQRPLRSIALQSEIIFPSDLMGFAADSLYFQGGKIAAGGIDFEKPYCSVQVWHFEKLDKLTLTGRVTAEDGSFTTLFGSYLTKFTVSGEVNGEITCSRKLNNLFDEATLGDWESAFGDRIVFGAMTLEKPGARIDFPLHQTLFQSGMYLKVSSDFPKVEIEREGIQRWYLQGKHLVASPDYKNPYCLIAKTDSQVSSPFKMGTHLTFGGLSGGYTKNGILSPNSHIVADLNGVSEKVRFYCSSATYEVPSYTDVSSATWGLLDWIQPL